jgi:short-subunit dehydrogenase
VRALVTGASSGLGQELVRRLAARGVEVWLAARRAALLDAEVASLGAAGQTAHAVTLDVQDADATHARLGALDDEVGGFDLVVANAGIGGKGPVLPTEYEWADARDILAVNLVGAVATLLPFVGRMAARGRGHLVGISSIAADFVNPRGAVYGASKAGLSFFLESLDVDLRPRGVAVTAVHPGFIKTDAAKGLNDRMPLAMTTERAAELIDRGIQRRARMVRFPWATGAVARTLTSLPRPLRSSIVARATRNP